ncbi:hypothetical protein [Paraburkholderia silvatlantica]|uniref:Uncharacterized protein n=1 Tax=Paraburkholderia silvatlantica TaxID=321895 RepID=A0ABR6FG67_9BURK|nr:hypothetical protein [Paraburkholderia silvatlantica]MBB2926393.1 hypothetical protein [Paraburkholderia silvatlantica]
MSIPDAAVQKDSWWRFSCFPGFSWVFLGFPGFSWVFLGFPGFSWVFLVDGQGLFTLITGPGYITASFSRAA